MDGPRTPADGRLMTSAIRLRDVKESDLSTFFAYQLDPVANSMAAFAAKNPADWEAFMAHWTRILNDDNVTIRTILVDEQIVGHVLKYEESGPPDVSYWIGQEFWGKGIATQALTAFLEIVSARPMFARAAKDNTGSIRVLDKCGFTIYGEEQGFSESRGEMVEEVLLKLS